ncbi:hypothetical protein ACQKII_10790 [Lysinibacillus sp. NPDC048646]|uniref:hypothetical protein n=1 Tax=Lysinibacillus sp. NPDC048646 TaxID=3390574 RepID=UPI003D023462
MLRRLLIITGIVMVGIASVILFNMPLLYGTIDATKEEQEPLVTKEELQLSISKKITEKLHEKYVGVDVKTTSKKEITIRVVGNEEYFNSVKRIWNPLQKV